MASLQGLVERLRAGRPLFTAWCGLPEPAIAGLLAREGFDAVTFDMQHGAIGADAVIRAIPLVGAAGKPALVRTPVDAFPLASQLLDAGASAVIAPMINSAEEAARFAAHLKYPPRGERSWGPHGALALSGLAPKDYFAAANEVCLGFAMIETREALGAIDAILAVEGLDAIFVGPSDLSIALSNGASLDPHGPETDAALDHALARARAAGKFIGVYSASGERGAELAAKGFDLIALGSDSALLRAGAQAALKTAKASAEDGSAGAY
jgi:4-hydroxy-2-oxoheptanedioate aldolase